MAQVAYVQGVRLTVDDGDDSSTEATQDCHSCKGLRGK